MKVRVKVRRLEDETHDGNVIKEGGEEWWEEYDWDVEDAEEVKAKAQRIVERFNNTLREHESPREVLGVEILGASDKHRWDRQLRRGPDGYEIGVCKGCGIEASLTPDFSLGGYKGEPLPPWDERQFRSCAFVRKTKQAEEVPCPFCDEPEGKPCRVDSKGPGKGRVREWPHKARVDEVEL